MILSNHCTYFWKMLYPETLLSNTNCNNRKGGGGIGLIRVSWNILLLLLLQSYCALKEFDRCHNWFHEVWEDFNCEDWISEANSENQWFCCCIGIQRFPYEIMFLNFFALKMKKCIILLHKCVKNGVGISIKSSLKKQILSG